jgi:hypothetical protein
MDARVKPAHDGLRISPWKDFLTSLGMIYDWSSSAPPLDSGQPT